jgi:2,5-dihydroxypyridine 5,6-dioxygenase
MPISDDFRMSMWRKVLDLSRLRAGEKAVVLTTESSHPLNIDAAYRAAVAVGATVCRIDVPPVSRSGSFGQRANVAVTPLTGNKMVVDVLKSADFVIDLMGLLHSPEQLEIIGCGTRMLMVIEPPEILAQLIPTPEDKIRVMRADDLLREAKSMHVTSKAGTDLEMQIGKYGTIPEYGFADEPGHWDHWPSAFTSTFPTDGTSQGRVVLDAGDMLFPFKAYVQSPVHMEIKDGYIRSIEGGFDAKYLLRHLESYNDPDAFAVSHVGWGLQTKARWGALGSRDKIQSHGMDGRGLYGNFLFSTGPNAEVGGPNHSACHVDIPMMDCTVHLDGKPVVVDGEVVAKGQTRDAA